jgi:predicted phosphodiesterase
MATLALISDIHGNSTALRAVLADIRRHGAEATYCLGDLVGYGPDPNGVVEIIIAEHIPTIAGNYDDGVGWERGDCGCYYASAEARRIGEASYAFTVREVTAENKAFLRGLPRDLDVGLGELKLHLVHGSPRKINEYLLRERDERTFLRIARAEDDDVLAFGHTHDSWDRCYGGVHFVNVGSAGRPKEGDPRVAYTLLRFGSEVAAVDGPAGCGSGVEVEVVRVAYDVESVARAVEDAGLPKALADAFRQGR